MSPFDPSPEEARLWIIDVLSPIVGLMAAVYCILADRVTPQVLPLIAALLTVPAISRAPNRPPESQSAGSPQDGSSASSSGSASDG